MSMDCAIEQQDGRPIVASASASASGSSSSNTQKQQQQQQQTTTDTAAATNANTDLDNDRKISAEVANHIRAEIAKENAMIYLDGPQIYTCSHCRTHLTSHDDIISKSFHGRHGRAYLFDQCVNVNYGKPENRTLITGIHSVCDIYCNRCQSMVGWTYIKAFEPSQKYKEGKFIIEKINLHLEETCLYNGIEHPAGERRDRGRARSMNWGKITTNEITSNNYHHEHNFATRMDTDQRNDERRSWSSMRQLSTGSYHHSNNSHDHSNIMDSPSSTHSIIYEYKAASAAAAATSASPGSSPTATTSHLARNLFRSSSAR